MKKLKWTPIFQAILFVIAIIAHWLFLHKECWYFPEIDVFYGLISLILWAILLAEIIHSIKNWSWLKSLALNLFLIFIISETDKIVDKEKPLGYNQASLRVIFFGEERNGFRNIIRLYPTFYTTASDIGEEGCCTRTGSLTVRADTLIFDENVFENTYGCLKSTKFIVKGDSIISGDKKESFYLSK